MLFDINEKRVHYDREIFSIIAAEQNSQSQISSSQKSMVGKIVLLHSRNHICDLSEFLVTSLRQLFDEEF